MAETIALTTPIVRNTTAWRVNRFHMNPVDSTMYVELGDVNGSETFSNTYHGADAIAKMTALNKANLTVKSMHRRILEQMIADFPQLAGTIAGTPD